MELLLLVAGVSTLMLAAGLVARYEPRRSAEADGISLVLMAVHFFTLLFYGAVPATVVSLCGAAVHARSLSPRSRAVRWLLINATSAVAAVQAAGVVHVRLGGTMGSFTWPGQMIPIAAAAVAYAVGRGVVSHLAVPLVTRSRIDRSWLKNPFRESPNAFIAAGLAVGVVEVIHRRAWEVVPVAALPLFFAYRAYSVHMQRSESAESRPSGAESLVHGVSTVDGSGRVTSWNDALAHIVGCPADRAVGQLLTSAVPSLNQTPLPRTLADAVRDRKSRTLHHFEIGAAAGAKTVRVDILPDSRGATLLWHDVTDEVRATEDLKRTAERFALVAEGSNQGLWEWDLRAQEFYASARWKAMFGLTPQSSVGRPDDWLTGVHADDVVALKAAIEAHLSGKTEILQHEHRIRHKDGSYRRVICRGIAAHGVSRRAARLAGSLVDKVDRAYAQEPSRVTGFRDPLTGLSNRADFVEALETRLSDFKQQPGRGFAALYLDLDRFKVVNDSIGHLAGDELLVGVSRRLELCLRPGDFIARLGGDEFALLLDGLTDETQANAIAFRMQDALSAPFSIGGREVFTSASIGIAFSRMEYTNAEDIVRDADSAMYHAKARGKARHELFDADMRAHALDRLSLESDLRHAVKNNAFEVYYQPIVSLATRRCTGFEALVRWKRNGETVSPAKFIPVAEELGLIEALGTWVLQEATRTFAGWKRRFPESELDCITVNVSTRQLMQQHFPYLVEQTVEQAAMKPGDLRLEITETALMDNPTMAAGVLKDLRDYGVKIYLDDFGTGYSSLSHLHKLPVDALKIDRSFVTSLLLDDRPAIVESILALARTLETSVVAEGVESDLQATELARLGCRAAQGYFFSRPLPSEAIEKLLTANEPLGGAPVERTFQAA